MAGLIDISQLGDARLQRKLHSLGNKIEKKIVRRALRTAAKVVLQAAKARVPVDTGALKKGLKVRATKRSRTIIGVHIRTPTRAELGIHPDDPGYYPAVIEYGAEGHAAQPFLRPAMDEARDKARQVIADSIRAGIAEAVR